MEIVIQTPRLYLRKFRAADAALILELNGDPEVTRYTRDPMVTMTEAEKVLQDVILPQYALYGFGRWAIHSRIDNSFVGWCGLKYRPELNEIDLGYRIIRNQWGKGFATEAAFASLRYGFEYCGLKQITGRALHANLASIKVLEKCSMIYRGEEIVEGLLHKTYDAFSPPIS